MTILLWSLRAVPSTNDLQTSDSENQADDNVRAIFGRSIRATVTISMQLIIMVTSFCELGGVSMRFLLLCCVFSTSHDMLVF